MKDPKIIRIHDRVKVINPQFFVRCGYPRTVEDEANDLRVNHKEAFTEFFKNIGLDISLHLPSKLLDDPTYRKVIQALAYARLKQKRFGGKERSIHTKEILERKDCEYTVIDIRYVKTGIYSPGSRPTGYYAAEEDYQPAYLKNEKTHKILCVNASAYASIDDTLPVYPFNDFGTEIEACHVKKKEVANVHVSCI